MNEAHAAISKAERHALIMAIIEQNNIATQRQLASKLKQAGCRVTQATLSRDVKELRLVKVARGDHYSYAAPDRPHPADGADRIRRSFVQYVTDITFSGHLLVVKTVPGSASVVAAAMDDLNLPLIAGTVAGDDAVLVIVKDGRETPMSGPPAELYNMFWSWWQGGASDADRFIDS